MKPLAITELVLRDAHQSLLATRLRLDDMLPIAAKLDQVGFWSLESWGGATFDACIRYLGEDPWVRLRELKAAMPNTPQQMLLRGQNLLGYRHYADDLVMHFVERAHHHGIDVFRIFDAMNDVRNLQCAIKATLDVGAHAQGTLCYTTSPVHTLATWVDMAKRLQDLGCHSLCIKDMAGLLKPYEADELIRSIKAEVTLPLALHCHATTGLSLATHMKAIEAGVDILDTAISTMSMTYGHSPTETVVAMLEGSDHATALSLPLLAEIADYFREVRKKYARYEGEMKGVDSRILLAQVPGGMLTNMESQLKEQGAEARLAEVLEEIPRVRADLGYIPLVTPTSQIVGTQAVLNVLSGARYKSMTKETEAILRGEYGQAPAPFNHQLQERVLQGSAVIGCRPADLLPPEWEHLGEVLREEAKKLGLEPDTLGPDERLTYALFPQVGLKFLAHRHQPEFFECATVAPVRAPEPPVAPQVATSPLTGESSQVACYDVRVDGVCYRVEVAPNAPLSVVAVEPVTAPRTVPLKEEALLAPLSGSIVKVLAQPGRLLQTDEVVLVMEAMKMEAEIRVPRAGRLVRLDVEPGSTVQMGQPLAWFVAS
ncbi:MAG: sodium-extruding oxaloacetate decarboxylase subunit alpha [Aeromonadaceae bacterium]